MTAGLVAMTHLDEDALQALNALGEELRQRLRSLIAEYAVDAQVVGAGSLFGLRFHRRPMRRLDDIVATADENRKTRFMQKFLHDEGMWMFGHGVAGCLSTANTPEHIDRLCEAVHTGLQAEGFNG